MTDDIIRWRPVPGRARSGSIDTRLDHIDDKGQRVYHVWPAGRPEPPGNPVKWSESTLREYYEMEKTGGERGGPTG